MICERCGGKITWRGPLAAVWLGQWDKMTHTQCEGCGGINCQCPDDEFGSEDGSEQARGV